MMRGKWKCHLVDHILLVCVWHDNSMVLSPHVALKIVSNSQCPSHTSYGNLNSLPVCRSPVVNMPSSRVTSYKADGADVRVVADEVDAVVLLGHYGASWNVEKLLESYLNSPPVRE